MMNSRRNDFIKAVADFLKISLENSITKEYLEVEAGFIADEWYLDFINHLGNIKTEYKRPLDIFTSAINSYKSKKFEILYANAKAQSKELLEKLQSTFRIFDSGNKISPEYFKYSYFMQVNREDKTKTPIFNKKELAILKLTGYDWQFLYGRRNDTYSLIQIIETAYKKSVEQKIKDTAVKLGNVPQIGNQATKLIKLIGDEPKEITREKIHPNMAAMMGNLTKKVRGDA